MSQCCCGREIERERLECLPNVNTCRACADHSRSGVKAYMVYSHKTAPQLVLVPVRNREAIRMADRAYRRSR